LTPTDVKQFVFCPRVTYFTRVMRLRPIVGSQQEAARDSHSRLAHLERRRKSLLRQKFPFKVARREFDVFLQSARLGVRGRADLIVTTEDGELIPVEAKAMSSNKGGIHLDHKYQLVLLASLVEDVRNCIIRRGFVHYMKDETTVQLPITDGLRRRMHYYLHRIRELIESGILPPPRRECGVEKVGCGFADRCRDLY